MRIPFAAACLLLAACNGSQPAPVETASAPAATAITAPLCTASMTREIAWTAADAKDVLQVEAIGKDCKEATLLFTVRTATGRLLWSLATPASDTWALVPDDPGKNTPEAGVKDQMTAWLKEASVEKSTALPDWPADKVRPEDPTGLFFVSPQIRETYLELRAKGLPLLCHMSRMNESMCIAFDGDTATGNAMVMVTRSS